MATLESIKRDFPELLPEDTKAICYHFNIGQSSEEDLPQELVDQIYDGIDSGEIREWVNELKNKEKLPIGQGCYGVPPVEGELNEGELNEEEPNEGELNEEELNEEEPNEEELNEEELNEEEPNEEEPNEGELNEEEPDGKKHPVVKPPIEYHIVHVAPKTELPDEILVFIGEVPSSGDTVYIRSITAADERKSLVLGDMLTNAEGREGHIYNTDFNDGSGRQLVAKIFDKNHCTRHRYEKITLMVTLRSKIEETFFCPGICFPEQVLVNEQNEFVGYLMPYAHGVNLSELLKSQEKFSAVFPNANKRTLIKLAKTILEKILFLHKRDILIGDVNTDNILVKSHREVFFVDTDSYQINRFPCPTYTPPHFIPPEVQQKLDSGEYSSYSDFMRTQGNELFSVAVLLFNIMMMGQNPYTRKRNAEDSQDTGRYFYPYPKEQIDEIVFERKFNSIPDVLWARMYDHLYYKLIDAFWQTFNKHGNHNREDTRYFVEDWQELLADYDKSLSRYLTRTDPADCEIYPQHFRHKPKMTYVTCKECGREVPATKTKYFTYSGKRAPVCSLCYVELGECAQEDCHRPVRITKRRLEKIRDKGWELPKWCDQHGKAKCQGPCGKLKQRNELVNGLCAECRAKLAKVACTSCGKKFPQQELIDGMCAECRMPKIECKLCHKNVHESECVKGICPECRENFVELKCAKCGKTFYITKQEHDECIKTGKTLPNLCPECPNSSWNFFSKNRQSKTGRFAN